MYIPKRLLFLLLLLGFVGPVSASEFKSALVTIDGLTCSMCSFGVEQSLRKLDFIEEVQMDLNANTAQLTFHTDKEISISDIARGVKDAGFSVRSLVCVAEVEESSVSELGSIQVGEVLCTFVDIEETQLQGEVSLTFIGAPFMARKNWKEWKKKCPEPQLSAESGRVREYCYVTL